MFNRLLAVTMIDFRMNHYALLVAVFLRCSPEEAFQELETPGARHRIQRIDPLDVQDMLALRSQGLTYREIGQIYNKKADAVYNIVRRATGRLGNKGSGITAGAC